jgi:hypothetical protein
VNLFVSRLPRARCHKLAISAVTILILILILEDSGEALALRRLTASDRAGMKGLGLVRSVDSQGQGG